MTTLKSMLKVVSWGCFIFYIGFHFGGKLWSTIKQKLNDYFVVPKDPVREVKRLESDKVVELVQMTDFRCKGMVYEDNGESNPDSARTG